MRSLVYKNSFKKEFSLIEKRGKDTKKLGAVIALLQQDLPLLEKHRDHALTGNWSGFRDCHIEPDWLLIYKKGNDSDGADILYLEATGSHADLFQMLKSASIRRIYCLSSYSIDSETRKLRIATRSRHSRAGGNPHVQIT